MKNHEQVMSIRESARLAELEKTIAKGQKTFVEVGLALAEIRDLRLYKREYASFREYCQKKWGWTKQHAYRLIECAPVAKGNTRVTSIRQAVELAKVEPGQRDEVVQRITESGEPVTAAAIKRQRNLPPPPPVRRGTGDGSQRAPASPEYGVAVSAKPEGGNQRLLTSSPTVVRDKVGREIPDCCLGLWQRAGEVQEQLTWLSRLKGMLRRAQEEQDPLYAMVNFSTILPHLEQAWTELKTALPYVVCTSCQGHETTRTTCRLCRGRGMISEFHWDRCVPEETKKIIRAGVGKGVSE